MAPEARPPAQWSDTENLAWKTPLPGFGSSSPIVVGERVFVTCYSGYATGPEEPGRLEDLRHHVVCMRLGDGKILWEKAFPAAQPERAYEGFITNHGYASATPASDGQAVYVFFGRSGVYAFSLSGQQLWHASVGTRTHAWGSAASPVLYENLVIINACIESGAVVALDKNTGNPVWRYEGIRESRSTPLVLSLPDGRRELIVSSRGRVFGLDPATGKRLWECRGVEQYVCPSVVGHGDVVFITAGIRTHTLAIRAGGQGDVSDTHILWESKEGSKVATPLYYDGHLYWVDHTGVATCLNAQTGKTVYKERLSIRSRRDKAYASPVVADGRIYIPTREDGVIVLAAQPELKELGRNRLDDASVVNASVAIAGNRLLLRSDRFLYCIGKPG
ncbi:MAG: outer membrane protein assembly factor BamB family protein [Thermoguttaceae bacterium]